MSDWLEISTAWQGGSAFLGTNQAGAQLQIGGADNQTGVSPMEATLMALAGCSGIDVLMILEKKRLKVESLQVSARGKRAETPPRAYLEIEMEYVLTGDLPEKDVEQAIRLSHEKYCSVGAMLAKTAKIGASFRIIKPQEATTKG